MKTYLLGYPRSQHLVPASKYLVDKYLPGFDVTYLNYEGELRGWSNYIRNYLLKLEDKNVILGLDDYLLSGPLDQRVFDKALAKMGGNVVCIKLCKNTSEELEGYPVTTQYCIWDREFLIKLLSVTQDPWDFEIRGSAIFKAWDKEVLLETCLDYPTNSALSSRWQGVKTEGNNAEDVKFLRENGYI